MPCDCPCAATACAPGPGTTATAACGGTLCSIPTSPDPTAVAPSTATTGHSTTPLDSPTSKGACTRDNIGNSCRPASPASAATLISCGGVERRPCRPQSKRSYVVCSSMLAHPKTSTSMVLRNGSTGMATESLSFRCQYLYRITPVLQQDYSSTSIELLQYFNSVPDRNETQVACAVCRVDCAAVLLQLIKAFLVFISLPLTASPGLPRAANVPGGGAARQAQCLRETKGRGAPGLCSGSVTQAVFRENAAVNKEPSNCKDDGLQL